MRSRYSGYCLGLVDYIIQTTAPEAADARGDRARWRQEIEGFCSTTQFHALEVLAASETESNGTVTFVARLQQGERDVSFRERSTFVRTADRWFYLSGKSEPI